MNDIALFGIQGSGKGTQATKILAEYPKYFTYEPGELIRALSKVNGEIGSFFAGNKTGAMLDNATTCAMFDMYTTILAPDQQMLMDGFPRNFTQMYHVLANARKTRRTLIGIYLDLNKNIAIQRLLNRYYIKKEGHLYPILASEVDAQKATGAEIVHREDDNIESITKRIDLYFADTMPVVRHFEDQGLLYRVDADQPINDVYNDIKKIIETTRTGN